MVAKAIERLAILVDIIPQKLSTINDVDFSKKSSPDKWSKKEILGHLIDSAANNHQRFIRSQFEDSPTIGYDQNQWVENSYYHDSDTHQLITFWTAYNQFLISIMKSISSEKLVKTCTMKDGTLLTIEFLIADYVNHLEHHLKQIMRY